MVAKNQYDYDQIREEIIAALKNGTPANWSALSKAVKIDQGTLRAASKREWDVTDPMELLGRSFAQEAPRKLGASIKEGANTLEIDFVSGMVCTLKDALEKSETDLKIWEVRDHQINFWPVGMKLKDTDGSYHPYAMQLCQVKVWLVRKNLKPIMPVIQPVDIAMPAVKYVKPDKTKLKRILIVPDPHMGFRRAIHGQSLVPFHDRRVLDIAVQIFQGGEFSGAHFIGDCMDLSEFSTKFTPEPEFYFTTQPALLEWAWWLGQFRASSPRAELVEYEGNHDKRMGDMIVAYMRAAYGLRPVDEIELPPSLSVERLLALHSLRVEYVKGYPDNHKWINQNVMVRHGDTVRQGPGDSAKAVVNKTTYTTIFGHVHRTELVTRRIKSRDGDIIQKAFCPGCACFTDGRVPGSTSEQQWQQGLAVIEYTDTEENIVSIPISEGKAIYNGRMLRARERDAEVEKMIFGKLEKLK